VGSYTELARYDETSTTGGIVLDTGLTNGTTYQFRYSVVNGNTTTNESGQSPPVSATPTAALPGDLPPGLPVGLVISTSANPPASFISWGNPVTGGPVSSYTVTWTNKDEENAEILPANEKVGIVPKISPEFTVLELKPADSPYGIYRCTVQAIGPGGSSETVEYP
jgi:hypothetical protein